MRAGGALAILGLVLLTAGAILGLFLTSAEKVAPDRPIVGGPAGPAGIPAAIASDRAPAASDYSRLPASGPSPLDDLLGRFDRIWVAPGRLQGGAHYEALRRRDGEVDSLARAVAALGKEAVPEIEGHLNDRATSYARKTFLASALSYLGSEDALQVMSNLVEGARHWRLREFVFRKLVGSASSGAIDVALEVLPRLDDPRLLLPVLKAEWDPDRVEAAYRMWLEAHESRARNQSYTLIAKEGGDWAQDILRDAAAADLPTQERAGAIQALAIRRDDGIIYFLRDLLWTEEDPTIIRALAGAIRRMGGPEGKEILKEYLASGPPDEVQEYVQRASVSPEMKAMPAGQGRGGPRTSVGPPLVDPERRRGVLRR